MPSAQDPVVSEAKVIDQRLSGEHGPFTALGARSPVSDLAAVAQVKHREVSGSPEVDLA